MKEKSAKVQNKLAQPGFSGNRLGSNSIIKGDCLDVLKRIHKESIDLIYIDPPFNTGKRQMRQRIKVTHNSVGDRRGFGGRRYMTKKVGRADYDDSFHNYIDGFLRPRMEEAYRVVKPKGSLFFHIDYREAHYCKILLDEIFGRDSFMNEIVWVYDFGARNTKKWSTKHDTIFWYAKDPNDYTFNFSSMDRVPYMAPGLVGPEKAKRGKTPTDVWWQTIVPSNGNEKTSYPTQKPLAILKRILKIHSNENDLILDFFAGSGTTGEAAKQLNRNFILIDNHPKAVRVMKQRLGIEISKV